MSTGDLVVKSQNDSCLYGLVRTLTTMYEAMLSAERVLGIIIQYQGLPEKKSPPPTLPLVDPILVLCDPSKRLSW